MTEGASPCVIKILLRAHLEGSVTEDNRGNTPLAYAKASRSPNAAEVAALLEKEQLRYQTSSSSLPPVSSPEDASPITSLGALIDRAEWNNVPQYVHAHPGEAANLYFPTSIIRHRIGGERFRKLTSLSSKLGLLPLHYACAADAPLYVIEALLTAYPDGAKISNDHGDLPLRK